MTEGAFASWQYSGLYKFRAVLRPTGEHGKRVLWRCEHEHEQKKEAIRCSTAELERRQ